MNHVITFCDESMTRSAALCLSSAEAHGADTVELYTHERFTQTDFYRDNEPLLSQPRGKGYWVWKPHVFFDLMKALPNGEIAIYLDAGVEVINNLNYIVDRMDQDIFLFGNMHEHAHWCKRDIIEAIMPGTPWEAFGKQVQASAIFVRVTEQTRAFIAEWLEWCVFDGGRLVDDSPSRINGNHPEFAENRYDQSILTTISYREGALLHWWPATYQGGSVYPRNGNHPDFKENRHDQAILTTMAYRKKLPLHHWAVRYNLGRADQFDHEKGHYGDNYPVIFHHHRLRDSEWPV